MGGQADPAAKIIAQRRVREAGMRQTYHEQDGKIVVRTTQDVEPHLKYAADCRREERERIGRTGKRGDFHRTMSTPFNVYYAACQRLGIPLGEIFQKEQAQRIAKELKRPEFAAFRTTNDKNIGR